MDEYVRLTSPPGVSDTGLVILKGANVGLVFQWRSRICVADEGIMKAKVAEIRRRLHMMICSFELESRGNQWALKVMHFIVDRAVVYTTTLPSPDWKPRCRQYLSIVFAFAAILKRQHTSAGRF